jgi:hypothetical protein
VNQWSDNGLDSDGSTGFVEWAKNQMEAFAEMFRRQVYVSDAEQKTVSDAKRIAFAQSRRVCVLSFSDVTILTRRP